MSLPTGIVAASDQYRLALLTAFANATPAARKELAEELAHQRSMDRLFIKVEIGTLIGVAVIVLGALVTGIALLITGHLVPGALTLVGDTLSTAGVALGRSYFIDRPSSAKKQLEPGGEKQIEEGESA
ncbi:hypothetical protein ACRU13_00120 [Mycobacterium colombiense]